MSVIVTVIEAVLLLTAGMAAILALHYVILWFFAIRNRFESRQPEKSPADEGLSTADLEKLPKLAGKEMAVTAVECAVCLEEIQGDEVARVVPVCNHGFHLECADTWLSKHPVCPLCRAQIKPDFHSPSDDLR